MDSPHREAVMAMMELMASEQGRWLPWLLEALSSSPLRYVILDLYTDWQVEDAEGLGRVARKAAQDLDRLEQRPIRWRHPREIVGAPHLEALCSFAWWRSQRVKGPAKLGRLELIAGKLEHLRNQQRQRRKIDAFLSEPGRPVDPQWLRKFLERPSPVGMK